ncbi:seryl-tRNA synthetase [Catenulispora sp. EB89]|uniref:hypothetical protein n=1 Tax=Catenulispora sp. EB89 TaxID=3156257 RepID=UPI003514814F
MTETIVELETPVPLRLEPELAKRILFVSAAISDFTLVRSDRDVVAVALIVSPGTAIDDLARKVNAMAVNDVVMQRVVEPRVLWTTTSVPLTEDDPFAAMIAAGAAVEMGEGMVALSDPLIPLAAYLDGRLRRIAVDELGGVEYQYPTVIATETLRRCGYLESFPQHLMFVTRLHTDMDVYNAFGREVRADPEAVRILDFCRNTDYSLPPTMCFHTYQQLSATTVPQAGSTYTARGKSFRFESHYRRGLERLWNFTIRETVFVGSREFVVDCRRRFLQAAAGLVEELGLSGRCEVASDPFFLGDSASKAWSQRMHELKYELILGVGAGREVAVGSFNFHERFFGEAFAIRAEDQDVAYTACVGFGLERFVLAFVARHGLDPRAWPIEL